MRHQHYAAENGCADCIRLAALEADAAKWREWIAASGETSVEQVQAMAQDALRLRWLAARVEADKDVTLRWNAWGFPETLDDYFVEVVDGKGVQRADGKSLRAALDAAMKAEAEAT
jgi:hypothetical protein